MSKLPLDGIRIADFTWWIAGTMCTRLPCRVRRRGHQDRVYHPGRDQIRDMPGTRPGTSGVNASQAFNGINAGKYGITLNPKHPKGLEVAQRLVSISDIVADNMTWGAMARLGLGYQDLVKIKPDLIVLSMPVMGPRRTVHALYGQRRADSGSGSHAPPHRVSGQDRHGPRPGVAGLERQPLPRRYGGHGGPPLQEEDRQGAAHSNVTVRIGGERHSLATMDYSVNGRIQARMANRSPYGAPHGIYRCYGDDRWCAIAVFSDEEWQGLRRAMGDPEWSRDSRFATALGRAEHVDELDRLIEEWTSGKSPESVMKELQGQGVAAGIVQNGRDLLENDPHMREQGHYLYLDHPEIGSMALDTYPFRLSSTPGRLSGPAPLMGEHNDHVLTSILGMSEDEVNELIIEGVLE